jgi:heme/copper-type cytochrome/quinol oxidase subunit 3
MQNQNLLEEELSREEHQALQNKRAGMFIFQVSWIMAFVALIVVNWQMRFSPVWKPEGTPEANPLIGIFATLTLVFSSVLIWRSLQAIRNDDIKSFLVQLAGTIGLGGVFILTMLVEWFALPEGTNYAKVFRLMTGFHMFHAFVIGAYLVYVWQTGRMGAYNRQNAWAVEAGAKLWYFVLVAWLLFYIVIYWV